MNTQIRSVIIIDENPIDILIVGKLIKIVCPMASITIFNSAKEALVFFRQAANWLNTNENIILLDLEMPTMDGWDFLREYKEMPLEIQNLFKVYILSCSNHLGDMLRAKEDSLVKGYLLKPLEKNQLVEIVNKEC